MAILEKRSDREDWVRWAIAFMQRGLWLAGEIEVHGPHDPSGLMWGNEAWARPDDTTEEAEFCFTAKARRSKYDPVRIRIWMGEADQPEYERTAFPLVKASELTPRARRWLRAARRTAENLRTERKRLRRAVSQF